jgi:peptide/nickel transport system substrate-binding protein
MRRFLMLFLLTLMLLTACKAQLTATPVASETEPIETQIVSPTATPTAEPPVILTVCTSNLPSSLFPYDGLNPAVKENLLTMTQGNLFDKVTGVLTTSILESVPSLDNGGITLSPVSVQRGQTVVDARGELVTLKAGVSVRPSGCQSSECAIDWDGESDLTMDQMSVSFQLADGLIWSDGVLVTATDSVFSYSLASDPAAPGMQWYESRTSDYTASDEKNLTWKGKPGFTTTQIDQLFWVPLPVHLFDAGLGWEEVSSDTRWTSPLPGFGLFQVVEWGDTTLKLERNPFYNLNDSSMTDMDQITLQVIADPNEALVALESGTCDILDQSYNFENNAEALAAIKSNPALNLIVGQSDSWEQLVFGIYPASYDDYYNPVYGDRPDIFGDVRTRQAVAACLDREAIQQTAYSGLADLWPSFVQAGDSQLSQDQRIAYDPALGIQLLEAVGWRDHDSDPSTAMQAWYVSNVPLGTELSVDLYVDQSSIRQAIAAVVQQSLGQCGIAVNIISQPAESIYAPGPNGPLFGRQFDLALLAWAPLPDVGCTLYESWQIPTLDNDWIGTNIAGFSDSVYDAACSDAALALENEDIFKTANSETIFINELPAIPIISQPYIFVSRLTTCDYISLLSPGLCSE